MSLLARRLIRQRRMDQQAFDCLAACRLIALCTPPCRAYSQDSQRSSAFEAACGAACACQSPLDERPAAVWTRKARRRPGSTHAVLWSYGCDNTRSFLEPAYRQGFYTWPLQELVPKLPQNFQLLSSGPFRTANPAQQKESFVLD